MDSFFHLFFSALQETKGQAESLVHPVLLVELATSALPETSDNPEK